MDAATRGLQPNLARAEDGGRSAMSDAGLGRLEATYRKSPLSTPALVLIGVGLLVYALQPQAVAWKVASVGVVLLGLLLQVAVLSFRLKVYARGIVASTLFGRRTIPFDAQAGIMTRVIGDDLHFYFRHGERQTHVAGIRGAPELLRRLQRIERDKLYPLIVQAYEDGKLIDFGELRIKGNVLHFGSRSLRVEHLKRAEFKTFSQTKVGFGATLTGLYVAWGEYAKTDFRMYDKNDKVLLHTDVGGLFNFNVFVALLQSKYVKIVGL